MQKNIEVFNRRCGEILLSALSMESLLDLFISDYFCSPQSYKTAIFSDVILRGFEKKVQVFKNICDEESINETLVDKIMESIRFVQNIRNRIAHDQRIMNNPIFGEIVLQKRKSVTHKKDEIILTPELMEEIDKNHSLAIREITRIHLKLSKVGVAGFVGKY